jgi:hypothetical protein
MSVSPSSSNIAVRDDATPHRRDQPGGSLLGPVPPGSTRQLAAGAASKRAHNLAWTQFNAPAFLFNH